MTIEYSTRGRPVSAFPPHWTGIKPGQGSEERAGAIIVNIARDLEARGDFVGAEQTRQAFIHGSSPDAPTLRTLIDRWAANTGSSVDALALATTLGYL